MNSSDVIVIGGGVIGCSIAYELAKRGQKVTLLERGRTGSEASSAAAGMLGAQSEMEDTGPLFQWSRLSRSLFPNLAEELKEVTGIDIGLVREGLLYAAFTEEQKRMLQAREELQLAAGEQAQWMESPAAREVEPLLGPEAVGALYLPNDGQVDAPLLAQGFARAAAALGVQLREYTQVLSLLRTQDRVIGVQTGDGPIYGGSVIAAAGTWSTQLLSDVGVELPMYPVKGECFSVLMQRQTLRKTLYMHGGYIVPKAGGRLVIGATSTPKTYDRKVTFAGLAQLMEQASRLMPSIAQAEWEKAWSGLRPQTADGLPYIGPVSRYKGLFTATGHYRNGILLSPLTGKVLADMVLGEDSLHNQDFNEWKYTFTPGWRAAEPASSGTKGKELHAIEASH